MSGKLKVVSKPEPHWYTVTDISASMGVCAATITSWKLRPEARVGNTKYYTLKELVENRLRSRIRASSEEGKDTATIEGAKLQEIKERTEKLAIENAIKRKDYAKVETLEAALSKMCSQISSVLDSIPVKVKRRCPKLKANDIAVIKKEIIKCQNLASEVTIKLDS